VSAAKPPRRSKTTVDPSSLPAAEPAAPAAARGKRPLAVLVTGATSGLGRVLTRYLYYDDDVRFVLATGREPKPYFFDQYDPAKFHYARLDITRGRELKNLFYSDLVKDVGIDAVVHMAIRNRADERSPESAHRLNVQGTRNMLEFALETDSIRKFVFTSSHIVYRADPMNPVFLDEESDLNFDLGIARWTKDRVDADLMCRSKMDDPRLKIVVLRYSNIYGRGINRFMYSWLNSPLSPHPLGFDPMINLLHPRDAVRAIQLSLAHRDVAGVFNVVGKETGPLSAIARSNGTRTIGLPGDVTLRAFNRLQRLVGASQFHYEVDPSRLYYPCMLDGRKAQRVLGYEPLNHVELG
jgi:UDP-glucose 4-epimerase